MHLTEPVTMLTDYVLSAVSLAFAISLSRFIGSGNRVSAWFWCAAFIAAGVAALAGGTWHGLTTYLDAGTRHTLWNIVMFSLGAAVAFMTAGIHAAKVSAKDGTVKWFVWGIVVTLLGGVVQQTRFLSGTFFNHNDAFHLIQVAGLYFFYRCARTVHDRPGVPG